VAKSRMSDQGMRGLLAALEANGELHRVKRLVDLRFEIASVLSLRQHGPIRAIASRAVWELSAKTCMRVV